MKRKEVYVLARGWFRFEHENGKRKLKLAASGHAVLIIAGVVVIWMILR